MEPTSRRPLCWTFLGRVPYGPVAELQEALRQDVRFGRGPEHLLLLEHEPVFTLGRNAAADDILAPRDWLAEHGVAVHESNRGGQVTYHGPGQLVGYPILDLNPDRRDIRRYVHDLQEALIRVLAEIEIRAHRKPGKDHIGVWVDDLKIASIGVHLARWITNHGFALNLATDLSHFTGIVACGLPQVQMASVESLTGKAPELQPLARRVAHHLGDIFERDLQPVEPGPLLERLATLALPEVR